MISNMPDVQVSDELVQAVTKARTKLVLTQPFFATLLMRLPVVFADIPTAATDMRRIYLSPRFAALLTCEELQFLLCHEVMHVVAQHADRRGPRDPKVWNMAADYAINDIIAECGLPMPGTDFANRAAAQGFPHFNPLAGLHDPKFAGMAAEPIYDQLPPPEEGDEGGDGDEGDEGGEGGSKSKSQPNGDGDLMERGSGPADQADAPEGADDAPGIGPIDIHQAAQAAKRAGRLPAALESAVASATKAKVRWTEVLRQFLMPARDDYSIRRPNRRYASMGVFMPGPDGVQCGPIAFGWDTSGSMHSDDIRQAAGSECTSIIQDVRPVVTHVLYADTQVGRREDFGPDDPIVFRPVGGGGTDFRPVFDHIEREGLEPEALVFFTDMYGTFPSTPPPYPVLWVSLSRGVPAPFGEVIEI